LHLVAKCANQTPSCGSGTEEIGQLREQLRSIPLDDRDTWSTVARQTAAAFAAWSNAVEETPGDLAEASDALAKSAQTYRRPVKRQRAGRVAMSGATMLLASVARGGQGRPHSSPCCASS
jgi:hypothetical protein